MIGKDYPELVNPSVYTQIIPASGWKAVFVDEMEDDDDTEMVITTDYVVCWALETTFESRLSMNPVSTQIVGIIATPRLEAAEDSDNFLGYVPEGTDTANLHLLARHVFKHLKDEEDGQG